MPGKKRPVARLIAVVTAGSVMVLGLAAPAPAHVANCGELSAFAAALYIKRLEDQMNRALAGYGRAEYELTGCTPGPPDHSVTWRYKATQTYSGSNFTNTRNCTGAFRAFYSNHADRTLSTQPIGYERCTDS